MRRLIQISLATIVVAAGITSAAGAQSYVSPDAQKPTPVTDLRSPDARDVVKNPVATYTPGRAPTVQPQQAVLLVASSGFNWGDAGIGAAGTLALIALVFGTLMIASHRRRGPLATS